MGGGENSEHPRQSKVEIAAAESLAHAGEKLHGGRESALGGRQQAVDKGPLDRGVPAQKGPTGSFRAQSQARSDTRRRSNSSRITWRKSPIRGTGALPNDLSHVSQQASPAGPRQLALGRIPDIAVAWADSPWSFAGLLSRR